jgi:hypothetical protein
MGGRTVAILICGLGFSGCLKKSIFESREDFRIQVVNDIPQEVGIPIQLWDQIEGKTATPEKAGAGEPLVAQAGSSLDIFFGPLRVLLVEKNEGVLREPKFQIDFPLGGGKLDLSEFTSGKVGTFFFGLEIPDSSELTNFRVFYVGGGKRRKIDGEIFGTGCKKFVNISDHFQREMSKEGIRLNTSRNRHVTVLAGNFVLTAQRGKQIVVTQLTVTDSKNQNLLCSRGDGRNPKESPNESDPQSDN